VRDSTTHEQSVLCFVEADPLGHAHIGVTATAHAHVRLPLQRDAIDTHNTALDGPPLVELRRGVGYMAGDFVCDGRRNVRNYLRSWQRCAAACRRRGSTTWRTGWAWTRLRTSRSCARVTGRSDWPRL